MFDSFTQDNRLAISRFYWFWFVRTVLKNVKKFSRIVCVSLFSYQGLLCLSLRQLVYFISSQIVCQVLFSTFFKLFWWSFLSLLTTWILYHIFCLLSTVNFIFLKSFLIVCFLKTIICDSSVIIPLGVMLVNHKFQFF